MDLCVKCMNLQKNLPPQEEQREEEQRPIQADTGVTGTEKTVTRPIQALPEIILQSKHSMRKGQRNSYRLRKSLQEGNTPVKGSI